MKTYRGSRTGHGLADVKVNGAFLNPRLDLWKHSLTGYEWGYGGSGPAQLALAILADHLGNDQQALACYQAFKRSVIASLPYEGWTLTSTQIDEALERIRGEVVVTGGVP